MRQRPKLIDRENCNRSESLALVKVRKLEKRLEDIEATVDSHGFTLFHPDGRVSEVKKDLNFRINQLKDPFVTELQPVGDRVDPFTRPAKNRLNLLTSTTNLCLAVILLSVTAMVARTAFDFVTMPAGSAVEVTGNEF